MPYAEAFAEIFSNNGIPLDPSVVPDQGSVDFDVQQLREWLSDLEDDTRVAIDEITTTEAIQAGLAADEVGIVQSIGGVLAAFDALPISQSVPISASVEMIADASAQAADAPSNGVA
jgi:hypothetical protein